MKVTADAYAMWNKGGNSAAAMVPAIAKDSGMSEEDTVARMSTFVFPSVEDQLSAKWLGGGAQEFMKGVADVFVNAGSIDSALGSYAGNVNTGPLAAAGN